MGDHGFDRLEHHDDGRYMIVCSCGWRSSADPSAEVVGSELDDHLQLVRAANGR